MKRDDGRGHARTLHDPVADRLDPVYPLDLRSVRSIDDLVRAMGNTAFTGRQLGEATDVLEAMIRDPDCFVVMTVTGAMTVAKMGLVITELIDQGMVHAIVTTGALMAHGLVEATGRSHFRHDPARMSDAELYEAGYNRVYDTLEPEKNLDDVEAVLLDILGAWDAGDMLCSYKLHRALGKYLADHARGRGILKSAYERDVPVFVPAFTDSELGLDYALANRLRQRRHQAALAFDPFLDLERFAEILLGQTRLGIFTIGGGVPRNWAQQFGPFLDVRRRHLGEDVSLKRYHYGVRVCPEPVHWGGLSGSSYTEAVSWGKFVPPEQGGRFGEVFVDATIGLPIMVAAVLQRLGTL